MTLLHLRLVQNSHGYPKVNIFLVPLNQGFKNGLSSNIKTKSLLLRLEFMPRFHPKIPRTMIWGRKSSQHGYPSALDLGRSERACAR